MDFELTNQANDCGTLHMMSQRAKEVMGVEELTMLGDKGFSDGADLSACEASGVSCLVASPKGRGPKMAVGFERDQFSYDKILDCYVCPCGHRLGFRRLEKHRGEMWRVYENYAACRTCAKRGVCTRGSYRRIVRSPYAEVLEVVERRVGDNVLLYKSRSYIVEHAFGTVKVVWGFKRFLCRGRLSENQLNTFQAHTRKLAPKILQK